MASIFFLPKTMQMIAVTKPYRLRNMLVSARRYSGHGDRPQTNGNDGQTHSLTPTASDGVKLNDSNEVSSIPQGEQGKGNRSLGAKTAKSSDLSTS